MPGDCAKKCLKKQGGEKMTYCPNCFSFNEECHPDPEDYDKPCRYYKPNAPEDANEQEES